MLHENLKTLRREAGYTQEELAARLHVVRQTVSKWEKGLSVPDAELLSRLAEILDTDVSVLLGGTVPEKAEADLLARQLAEINEQLAVRSRRSKRLWRIAGILLAGFVLLNTLLLVLNIPA